MKIISFFFCLLFTTMIQAQLIKVAPGTDLTILSGTIFKADSFLLTPSANFTLTDNSLTKSATISHASLNPYISPVYQFTNSTNPYSGSLQIYYTDGAQLNGIPESSLSLNVHTGTSWIGYPVATRDATNNFILTTGLSAINLNEFTLADMLTPLPLIWKSFTATRQNQTAVLQWTTRQEQNTRNFAVQHSSNNTNWSDISILPAAGNSNIAGNYSYVHTNPVTGINYYRILQSDMDNRHSYSAIRILVFTTAGEPFIVTGNPVTNKIITVQVNRASLLGLYNSDGKLMWQEQVNAGTKYIDVSRYAKGTYLLRTNSTVQKVVIQ